MIIKSMSRKEPTFGQLAAYMSSEKSDARYDIHHRCVAGSDEAIAREFYANSELLRKRANANYLYHEIVSITTEGIQDRKALKETLQKIAERYIQHRCPQNMVYGCLHEDHSEHLHYHLMISANEKFDDTRHFLTRKKFDQVKRNLEAYVLKHYPQLKQKEVMTAVSQNEKMSIKGDAMKRRTGSLPQREEVSQLIQDAMAQTNSMDNFCFFLNERGYDFYVRGKNFGVKVTHENGKTKSYRFSTLGLHNEFQAFQDGEFVKREEESFSQAHKSPEPGIMTDDVPEVEKVAQSASAEDVLEANSETEAEKPIESENRVAVEKEKQTTEIDAQQEHSTNQPPKKKRATVHQKKTVSAKNSDAEKPKSRNTSTKSKLKMKIKDILGVRETIKERKNSKAASRAEVQESIDQSNRRSEEHLSKKMEQSEKQTAKRTVDDVRKEFERMSEQRKESDKHKPKHSQ